MTTATIKKIQVRPVLVPLETPVRTAAGDVTHSPLALVDITTSDGIVGSSYVFTYTPLALKPVCLLIDSFAQIIADRELAPLSIEAALAGRLRLLGNTGLTLIAIAAIDMACWDALAKKAELPLARLLGGDIRPIRTYLSVGMDGAKAAGKSAERAVAKGFSALKIKIGYSSVEEDKDAIRSALAVLGKAKLMIDYNQSLDVPEGIRRCEALEEFNLQWIEEPTLQDDYKGHAKIAAATRTPIQLGENWYGTSEMQKSIEVDAADYAMIDVMKIGGVTGWLRAARLAEAASMPLSSHIFPEVSAHLMCATPTAHWLEFLTLASPILKTPLDAVNGAVIVPNQPGAGIEWKEDAVGKYAVT